MTELEAAVEHIKTFADAWQSMTGAEPDATIATAHIGPLKWALLTLGDIRLLLAAVDPAEQPIPHIPTPQGRGYLAKRSSQQATAAQAPLIAPEDEGIATADVLWQIAEDERMATTADPSGDGVVEERDAAMRFLRDGLHAIASVTALPCRENT